MYVHFYEIRGCICDNVDNRPVLVAPRDTRLDLLTKYQFVLLTDGRWVHFLTNDEYAHVMTGYPNRDVTFCAAPQYTPMPSAPMQESEEDCRRGNLLAGIGLGLFVLYLIISFGEWGIMEVLDNAERTKEAINLAEIVNGFLLLMPIASFVLMLITRIRYPKNVMGKVLMWVFIVSGILLALFIIAILVTCVACLNECSQAGGRC